MTRDADRRLEQLIAQQRLVFRREQAIRVGVPASTIDHRVATGRYLPVFPGAGTYRPAEAPVTRLLRYRAAVLAVGGEAVLSRHSAADVLGIEGAPRDDLIHVTVRDRCFDGLDGIVVHRTGNLPDDHWRLLDGIRVMIAERTIAELACPPRPRRQRRMVGYAIRTRMADHARFLRVLEDLGRFRGKSLMRELLDEIAPAELHSQSELESRFFRLMRGAGVPPTAMNHPVRDVYGRRRYLDAVWLLPAGGVSAIPLLWCELNGSRYHDLGTDRTDDRDRINALVLAGFPQPLVYGWWDVTRRGDAVVRDVRIGLAAASSQVSP